MVICSHDEAFVDALGAERLFVPRSFA